jgi:hypothetical protein
MSKSADFFQLKLLPIYLVDYIWVITIYGTTAIFLAVLIDGYLLPPYDEYETIRTPTWKLYLEVILQLALQGFIAVVIITVLQNIPSPVEGMYGYGHGCSEALIIRTPAILSVLLFFLSKSMKARIETLFSRFDKNALTNIYSSFPK